MPSSETDIAQPAHHRRPRLLFVVTLAEVGGVASYAAQLLPGLVEAFDVRVAARGDGPLRTAAESLGIPFIPLRRMRRNLSPVHDVLAVAELYRLMRRERIEIVHAHSSKAGVLARTAAALARVPVRIFTVHGWAFAAYSGRASTLFRLADRAMKPLTSVVISPAGAVRDAGVVAGTCSSDRTVVIPNAVDTQKFSAPSTAGSSTAMLSVGRLAFPKDFSTLLRAVAKIDGDHVTRIVGDGPESGALEDEAALLGVSDRVHFLGSRDDVPALLAEAGAFVLSSRSECMPMSIIEAMAAGVAVVASDVGGVSELVVHGETGLLVPPGDPGALARALGQLLADPGRRERMGAAGRVRARELFDVELFRQRHVDLYLAALEGRPLPSL